MIERGLGKACAVLAAALLFSCGCQGSGPERSATASLSSFAESRWTWRFEESATDQRFAAPGSPEPIEIGPSTFAPADAGGGRIYNDTNDAGILAKSAADLLARLPRESFTIAAWVAVERTQRWGGIVSCVEDNGDAERGVVLGFNNRVFTVGLATEGADDGNGRMTYLEGKTALQPGRWHHVVATYDGTSLTLYVDGKKDAETREQSGPVHYAPEAPVVLGGYRDSNENHPLDGRLLEVTWASEAWNAGEVRGQFSKRARSHNSLEPWTDLEFEFLVDPYLTWPTENAVSILFETTFPAAAEVRVRKDTEKPEQARVISSPSKALHEVRVEGLEPHQKYFYSVQVSRGEDSLVSSALLSFRTAARENDAYTFVVIGDTQTHGDVAKRVSDLAYMHRPNFVVHAGDLVDTGSSKRDWTDTFFPSMQPLIARSPMMPVLGNHEQDAAHYYQYMSLPEPERWYSFRYGNAEFFMIDGNRSLSDQSAQLEWLTGALEASTATWRFAILHQPPYTSDSNDYGNTLNGSSTRGDMNVRNIVEALEIYGVDICFSGHVHDYERTFPIREGQVAPYEKGGVIYVTAAGGGGSLENFDPANTWFGHKKVRSHHFVYVAIHGDRLEFQAIDEQGRLFDSMVLKKRSSPEETNR